MGEQFRNRLALAVTLAILATAMVTTTASATPEEWSAVGPNGASAGLNDDVFALYPTDDGVLVGGLFANAGGGSNPRDSFALWNGTTWETVDAAGAANGYFDSVGDYISAIAMIGDNIYAAGSFLNASGDADADNIAMFNATAVTPAWEPLDVGLGSGVVHALAVHNNTLYAGGEFVNVDGDNTIDYVAKWNGSSWSSVGSLGGDGALNHAVRALAVKNGTLYAAGDFTDADGDPEADYVAKFNGTDWVQLGGSGGLGALNRPAYSLLVDGPDIVVGGDFDDADNVADTAHIAKWGGGAWSALGPNSDLGDDVLALASDGSNIYAGGRFTDAGGDPDGDRIAMWDGSAWAALPDAGGNAPFGNTVHAVAVWDSNLFAGGEFVNGAAISQADYLASWGILPDFQPDGRVKLLPNGSFVGNNVYNTTGQNQKREKAKARNQVIKFEISIQNDCATTEDVFDVEAMGSSTHFSVAYFEVVSGDNITAAVTGGTYETDPVAAGGAFRIRVEITVGAAAPANSKITRVVTITSNGDAAKQDAVKVVGKRS